MLVIQLFDFLPKSRVIYYLFDESSSARYHKAYNDWQFYVNFKITQEISHDFVYYI